MMIDIIGGSYSHKYANLNSELTINWYVNQTTESEDARAQESLFPTPGLTTFLTLPGRYTRGLYTCRTKAHNRCFAVNGVTLYEILNDGTYTSRGTLTGLAVGSTPVYMVCNYNNQVGIFHPSVSYYFDLTTNTLTQITHSQFPGTVTYAAYADGYAFVVSGGAAWYSTAGSLVTWDGTYTYSPTFRSSAVLAIGTLREEIHTFTEETIEVYVNDTTTPYSRLPRSTVSIGIVAKDSLATFNDGYLFLGRQCKDGEALVYYYDGNQCVPISPFPITWAINSIDKDSLLEAYGFIQSSKDGHLLYYLTIPSLHRTFICDMTTKQWTERQSKNPVNDSDGENTYHEFRGRYFTSFKGKNLFSDLYSGKILLEDYNTHTETDETIKRVRISKTYEEETNISVYDLEIRANGGCGTTSGQGSSPVLMLEKSFDGGYNFTSPINISLGTLGNYQSRIRKQKLGTARLWTIKATVTDPVNLMLLSAKANGVIGTY